MFTDIYHRKTALFSNTKSVVKKTEKARLQRISELKSNINQAKTDMNRAIENFNNVTEPKLIDFYIYKLRSEQARFEQLMTEYKTLQGFAENYTDTK